MTGKEPKTIYSINPAAWQFWVTAATLFVLLWGGISFVADYQFNKRLEIFHAIAQPQIETYVDREVRAHAVLPAHSNVIDRLQDQEKRDAAADKQLVYIQKAVDQNARKLDKLLESR